MFIEHRKDDDLIILVRQFDLPKALNLAKKYDSYTLIAKVDYNSGKLLRKDEVEVQLPGVYQSLKVAAYADFGIPSSYYDYNSKQVNGLSTAKVHIFQKQLPSFIKIVRGATDLDNDKILIQNYNQLPHNFVLLVKTHVNQKTKSVIEELEYLLHQDSVLSDKGLSILDFNSLLFVSHEEELAMTQYQKGCYFISLSENIKLDFAGLWSIFAILQQAKETQQLNHPLFENLREGNWLLDYLMDRVDQQNMERENKLQIYDYLTAVFASIKVLRHHFKPQQFLLTMDKLFKMTVQSYLSNLHLEDFSEPQLVKLAVSLSMFVSQNQVLSPQLLQDRVQEPILITTNLPIEHPNTAYMSRDAFMAFNALFLLTKQLNLAETVLLQWASLYREGQIPTKTQTIDGRFADYNNFDCVWWFLKALLDYLKVCDDPIPFLKTKVKLDEEDNMTVESLIFQVFDDHRKGFKLLDASHCLVKMNATSGFIEIFYDQIKGLSWIETIGQSAAGYIRDGSPIELQGLLIYSLREILGLTDLFSSEYETELRQIKQQYSLIKSNFHKFYHLADKNSLLPTEMSLLRSQTDIYKDTVNSTSKYPDYMFRPNSLIAMALAPEVFNSEKALTHLRKLEKVMIEPHPAPSSVGIALLDPFDKMHDSITGKVNSRRYLWFMGFFIKAKLNFSDFDSSPLDLMKFLTPYLDVINDQSNLLCGLPEFTNGISNVKASLKSHACLVEAIHNIISH